MAKNEYIIPDDFGQSDLVNLAKELEAEAEVDISEGYLEIRGSQGSEAWVKLEDQKAVYRFDRRRSASTPTKSYFDKLFELVDWGSREEGNLGPSNSFSDRH